MQDLPRYRGQGWKGSVQVLSYLPGARHHYPAERLFVQQSTCPTCHGTGEIISDPCPVCRGEGRVREDSHITIRIPAGVATGSQLRIAGEGDAGVHGGPTGDLHVFIDVKPHDIFQREGNDLSCTVPVPLSLAVSGGRLKVPTLEGAATIKLPEGTQNGMIFRLRGKGVKALRGSDVGDMLVEVEVEIPSRLTKEQVDKLNAFASALDEIGTSRLAWSLPTRRRVT